MTTWANNLPYFSKSELACKGTGIVKLDVRFAVMLCLLRQTWGEALVLNSVCRTPGHNANVGGHPSSLHLTENPKHKTNGCMAADVSWNEWPVGKRLRFAQHAYKLGFAVGLHNTFCHVDLRAAIGLAKIVYVYGTWDNQFNIQEVMDNP